MKLGVLFSGGKDSTYAAWLAKQEGHEIVCLISLISENKESYMFHTPAITMTQKQAELIGIPLITHITKGEKEKELVDLKNAIKIAVEKYHIQGIVTGALASVYQASRIQKLCDSLNLQCINPLWQKNQITLLEELIKNKFEVIIVGVFAYPLDKAWIGRKIDVKYIEDVKKMQEKYKINPAGEGGEFESLVINCPLFKKSLNFSIKKIIGEKNSWFAEL
ncbi:MAG: diphthine--ammonia ligase [Candidatus Woesearchaeota archaeon]|jgi:ABC transporter with metal-binding/Fe-S-binding domain ATP-binding protein